MFFLFTKFEFDLNFRDDQWKPPLEQNSTNLFLFCKEEDIQYVMLPNPKWSGGYLNKDLLEMIKNDENFSLIEEFQYKKTKNYLFLFQLSTMIIEYSPNSES